MPKRVLVTGASGFVGANVARRALTDGHDVHLILRDAGAWRVRDLLSHVRVHRLTLDDAEAVRATVAAVRPEWVFHLAAYGAYEHQTGLSRMVGTNLLGCAALLDACVVAGVESFLNAGSSSEYGYKRTAASEDDLLEPNSHYAVTKAAATHYCQFTARAGDVHAATLRLYAIYGPFEEPTRLIPTVLVHAMRGTWPPLVSPDTARDFVYVDDAVEAMFRVADASSVPRGAVYNVSTGRQTRIEEIVTLVRSMLDVPAEPAWNTMGRRAWDTNIWIGSPEKIERELGWRAGTALVDGLERTVDWLRRHPHWLDVYSQSILKSG